jgi:hypothetical protein
MRPCLFKKPKKNQNLRAVNLEKTGLANEASLIKPA